MTHRQKTDYSPSNSFSTTDPSLFASRVTIDVLHVPTIRHMWLFKDERHGVISLPGTSAHSYSGFSVLSTPHLCGKCCVPLFCSVGGFCPFVWERHQTGTEGHMMAGTWSRWLFFLLGLCHLPWLSFFLFYFDGNFIIRKKKNWYWCHSSFVAKCFHSLLVTWSDVEGVKFFNKHTLFLAHCGLLLIIFWKNGQGLHFPLQIPICSCLSTPLVHLKAQATSTLLRLWFKTES